jgi:hypothetical protein
VSKRTSGYTALFAIVRIDLGGDGPWRERISVTKIVTDLETAESEVDRLQQLNGDKGCEYFWTPTRTHARLGPLMSSEDEEA